MPLLEFSLEVTEGQLAEIDRVKAVLNADLSRDAFLIICLEAGLLEAKHQADDKPLNRFED